MNPRELIRRTSECFRSAGIPDPDNDAALLLAHLTARSALELRLDTNTEYDNGILSSYRELVEKRIKRIPLQYLLEEAPFYRRVFKVDPRVLIPRPETELLCEWALEILKDIPSPRVLDLCCGSGCIGLTLKAERPDASVTLSDLSSGALNVTAVNAVRMSLDVQIRHSDLLEGRMEPRLALDGGKDGFDLYRRIIQSAGSVLVPGGRLMMEMGVNESDFLVSLLSRCGYRDIEVRKDYAGIERMIFAVLP